MHIDIKNATHLLHILIIFNQMDAEPYLPDEYHYSFKIVLLGDGATGKTSFVNAYLQDTVAREYYMTQGVDTYSATVEHSAFRIHLSIWDIAGQERFEMVRNMFLKGSMGAIICYDITRRTSFENLDYWIKTFRQYSTSSPIILIASKSDLEDLRAVATEEGEAIALKYNLHSFIELSSFSDANRVQQVLRDISGAILEHLEE